MKKRILVRSMSLNNGVNPYLDLTLAGLNAHEHIRAALGVQTRLFAVLRTAMRDRPDVIHFDWLSHLYRHKTPALTLIHSVAFLAETWLTQLVFGPRYTWTLHETFSHQHFDDRHVETWVMRRLARRCDFIRVFSSASVAHVSDFLGISTEKIRIVPHGNYIDQYPNQTGKAIAREQLGLASDARILLFFGNIRPYKGVDSLVAAFAQRPEQHWRLVIAGALIRRHPHDEQFSDKVMQLAAADPRIVLHDQFVPIETVQVYFNACDAVVLPFARIENSGSAHLAMGFARPVIAPRLGNLPDLLSKQPQLLYEPGDIAAGLTQFAALDNTQLHAIGAANLAALASHRWEDFAPHFVALFDDVTEVA